MNYMEKILQQILSELKDIKNDIVEIKQKQLEHDKRFEEIKDTIKHVDAQSTTIALYAKENKEAIEKVYNKVEFIK